MPKDETQAVFRECFSTAAGKKCFAVMLVELDFFNTDKKTEAEMARSNYASRLLKKLGVFMPENEFNVVEGIMNMSFKGEKQ